MDLLLTCQCLLLGFLFLAFLGNSWHLRPAAGGRGGDRKKPPEAAGAWPVLGHLPLLGGEHLPARTLGRLADEYGPVFIIRLGVHPTLVVSSQEAAKECFTTHDREFATRPRGAAGKYMGYDYSMFGLTTYGSFWRLMRRIAVVELLSSGRLEKLRHIRTAEVDNRIRGLYDLCTEGDPPKVEMRQWFQDTTFNVILRMVAGRRCVGSGGADDEDDGTGSTKMRRFHKALTESLLLLGVFVPSDAVPWLEWLDLRGYVKAMKSTARELDAVLVTWIEERRQERRRSEAGGGRRDDKDFIDVMMSTVEEEGVDLAGSDPDTAIKATVLAMLLGGADTSAITMTWALALLLNHRRVLDKLRDELHLHVGRERSVDEADVRNLVYLQAVVKETMRLYPAVPLSVPHEATADCRVGGYHVPAGTRLLTNLWKLHRDPRVWEDPLQFRPERFLAGDAAKVDSRGQYHQYIPFGSGRRICPGITFALQVMHLTLARLVHGFDLGTPDGKPVDMVEGPSNILTKAAPFVVLLTPLLPPQLYHHKK